jgi:phospholipid/cholesterol/gamma-HCH transport system substrate-binding protein
MKRALRAHMKEVVAILALAVAGIATLLVILLQQRASFPEWLPVLGEERFELQLRLSSAQAVTPGQGQTVNMAGVKIGDVTGVELEDGNALVSVEIEPHYAELIHRDATALMRPRTGLNDMTVELDPGSGSDLVAEGEVLPVSQTLPNVQPDEILRTLDADTRGYLRLLLAGGATGLGGHGEELSAGLRRLAPTARDIEKINGALSVRRENIRNAIHNFRLVSEELAANDQQLGAFVQFSNEVLGAFATEEASLRATLAELPSTLRATRSALESSETFSEVAAPALTDLIAPSAALGPALRNVRPFLERTLSPIRDQIRPFTLEVRKPVTHVEQLAGPLGTATSGLAGGTTNLNDLLDMLAYNPSGSEEGFLFWGSWLNHLGNALFLTEDANGPLRRGMVLLSCQTAGLAEGVASTRPFLLTLQEATRIPTSEEICPLDPITGF